MKVDLEGKFALVTGAARGIGRQRSAPDKDSVPVHPPCSDGTATHSRACGLFQSWYPGALSLGMRICRTKTSRFRRIIGL
jgi:hypothetical protein